MAVSSFSFGKPSLVFFSRMLPWEHPLPQMLYKYVQPARLDVLTEGRVRFSQRSVFDDHRELQPEYAAFGTESEIWRFILREGIKLDPRIPPNILVRLIAEDPEKQARATQVAQESMRSPEEFGLFCLTETHDCNRMWTDYAAGGTGFVIGFDTTHAGFRQLTNPGRIGKVTYSDEPFGTLLGTIETEGAGVFFRKRLRYAFEREWRSIRAFRRLECQRGEIYLSQVDPASIREIAIRADCAVEMELRTLVKEDPRYQHLQIRVSK